MSYFLGLAGLVVSELLSAGTLYVVSLKLIGRSNLQALGYVLLFIITFLMLSFFGREVLFVVGNYQLMADWLGLMCWAALLAAIVIMVNYSLIKSIGLQMTKPL